MTKRNVHFLSLSISLFIFISTLVLTIIGIIAGTSSGQPGGSFAGIDFFKPFTIQSNIFMAIISAIVAFFDIKCITKPRYSIPKWVGTLRLVGTATISVTIAVVIFVLTPLRACNDIDPISLYTNDMFFLHILNPILAIFSFIYLEPVRKYSFLPKFIATLPTTIYCVIYGLMVLVFQVWDDFYGFTFGGQVLYALIFCLITFAIRFAIVQLLVFGNKKLSFLTSKKRK